MSKCAICGNEILTGDIHWAIGICTSCYNKHCKSDEQRYVNMLHKETGELVVDSLVKKDKQIIEMQKQLEEKEIEIEKLNNALILDYDTREWRKICEIQCENKQRKDAYRELRKEYDERVQENKQAHILNDRLGERIEYLEQQLKSQPKEIIEKIKERALFGVFECKVDYTITEELLDAILKEYDN